MSKPRCTCSNKNCRERFSESNYPVVPPSCKPEHLICIDCAMKRKSNVCVVCGSESKYPEASKATNRRSSRASYGCGRPGQPWPSDRWEKSYAFDSMSPFCDERRKYYYETSNVDVAKEESKNQKTEGEIQRKVLRGGQKETAKGAGAGEKNANINLESDEESDGGWDTDTYAQIGLLSPKRIDRVQERKQNEKEKGDRERERPSESEMTRTREDPKKQTKRGADGQVKAERQKPLLVSKMASLVKENTESKKSGAAGKRDSEKIVRPPAGGCEQEKAKKPLHGVLKNPGNVGGDSEKEQQAVMVNEVARASDPVKAVGQQGNTVHRVANTRVAQKNRVQQLVRTEKKPSKMDGDHAKKIEQQGSRDLVQNVANPGGDNEKKVEQNGESKLMKSGSEVNEQVEWTFERANLLTKVEEAKKKEKSATEAKEEADKKAAEAHKETKRLKEELAKMRMKAVKEENEKIACCNCGSKEKRERMRICTTCAHNGRVNLEDGDLDKILPFIVCAYCYDEEHTVHEFMKFPNWKVPSNLNSAASKLAKAVSGMHEHLEELITKESVQRGDDWKDFKKKLHTLRTREPRITFEESERVVSFLNTEESNVANAFQNAREALKAVGGASLAMKEALKNVKLLVREIDGEMDGDKAEMETVDPPPTKRGRTRLGH